MHALENFNSGLDNNTGEVTSMIAEYGRIVQRRGQSNMLVRSRPGDETGTEPLSTHLSRPTASQSTRGLQMKRLGVRSHLLHLGR